MTHLDVLVRSRLEVRGADADLSKELKKACTHSNPDFYKKKAMGMYTGNVPRQLMTWHEGADGVLLLPRGATDRLRELSKQFGQRIRWIDERVSVPVTWPEFVAAPGQTSSDREYQLEAERICRMVEQGIIRSPTGSGKTHVTLSLFARLHQRALVIVRDRQLLEQWIVKAEKHLGLKPPELGVVRGGKKHTIGTHLTLALQQTLYTEKFDLEGFAQHFGAVAVDEVHLAAARTVSSTIDVFPARYRLGFSADETRKDKKEFLIYDLFGRVIFEITRAEVEEAGFIVPVVVRLVPTDFKADWYRNAPPEERDYKRLVDEMIADPDRNALIRHVVLVMVREKQDIPALVFTHRREHGQQISTELAAADGVACGIMMGGAESAGTFAESRDLLERGKLPVAVGTFQSIGTGIDLPNVRAGIVSTPLGNNRQFFNQVRGRLCRNSAGKTVGHLYYLWDRDVFPRAPRNLFEWNDGNVEILNDSGRWTAVNERDL